MGRNAARRPRAVHTGPRTLADILGIIAATALLCPAVTPLTACRSPDGATHPAPPTESALAHYVTVSRRFLDAQRIESRRIGGKDFDGLYQSYKPNPRNPASQFIAAYGRVWPYDSALGVYADLKTGRFEHARRAVDALVALGDNEERSGFRGLWHFSYNTLNDDFVDPRGPLGGNLWALSAILNYILVTGDTRHLDWANARIVGYVFDQQVIDPEDRRYGFFRAGLENAADLARGDAMGYHAYEGPTASIEDLLRNSQRRSQVLLGLFLPDPLNKPVAWYLKTARAAGPSDDIVNSQVEYVAIEHQADAIAMLRLAGRAAAQFRPEDRRLSEALRARHALVMSALDKLWVADPDGTGHYVTGMRRDGSLNRSVAVDNSTWVAGVLLDYDEERAWACIEHAVKRFVAVDGGFRGLFFFTRDFEDDYVQLDASAREVMEYMIQPEATWGFVQVLLQFARRTEDPVRHEYTLRLAEDLALNMVAFQAFYAREGDPYERGVAGFADLAAAVGGSTARAVALGEPLALVGRLAEEARGLAARFRRYGTPYASRNVHGYFNTLESMAATATGLIVSQVMLGRASGDDFLAVTPPRAWKVARAGNSRPRSPK